MGFYRDQDNFWTLDIKPNHSYLFTANSPCGMGLPVEETGTWQTSHDTLTLIASKDSSIETYKIIRIDTSFIYMALVITDDYPFVSYTKEKGYYSNDTMSFSSDWQGKYTYYTLYYRNGRIKEAQVYRKRNKSGDWYYYLETGELDKVEKYRRNKLRKTKFQRYD